MKFDSAEQLPQSKGDACADRRESICAVLCLKIGVLSQLRQLLFRPELACQLYMDRHDKIAALNECTCPDTWSEGFRQ